MGWRISWFCWSILCCWAKESAFSRGNSATRICAGKHASFAVGHRHQYLQGRWTFAEPEIRSVSDAFHDDVIPKIWISRPGCHSERGSDSEDAPRHLRCGSVL